MTQDRFRAANEFQLDQLPEGTKIQVRPVSLVSVYKKLAGQWIPIEWHPSVYEPQVDDKFPAGSIAIHPNGISYVKGPTDCPYHAAGTQCLSSCVRPLCWLRVVPVHQPPPQDDVPADVVGPEEDIAMGAVVPAQDSRDGFPGKEPGPPNTNVMESYPLGPYLPTGGAYDHHLTGYGNGSFNPGGMSGVEEHSFPTAPGLSEEIHNAFNGLQLSGAAATQRLDPNGSVDHELQEVQPMDGPHSFTIYFNQEGGGIPLTLQGIGTLDNESLAFERTVSLSYKALVRFKFKYWQDMRDHADKRTQVNVRHGGRKNGKPFSLMEMANLVLSELTGEMRTMSDLNHPLLHRGAPVKLDELVLVRIERIKRGTLQPVFALRR